MIRREWMSGPKSGIIDSRGSMLLKISTALFICLILCVLGVIHIQAKDIKPRVMEKKYIARSQHWQLSPWVGESAGKTCDIFVRHERFPESQEIIDACGYDVFTTWIATPPCDQVNNHGDMSKCSGLFARYVGVEDHEFVEMVELPQIETEVKALNCIPGKWCNELPTLSFKGTEPLPDYRITNLYVVIEGINYGCEGINCALRMPVTGDQGVNVEYWASSSFGDESDHKTFKFRAVKKSEYAASYHIDILGDDWADYAASGSLLWNIFPPISSSMSGVLEQPVSEKELSTRNNYLFLAGNLIKKGVVDPGDCPGNGLTEHGTANTCGAQVSTDHVIEWQNEYDHEIYRAALKYNVPAKLVKAIIAQESQFWPDSDTPYELGLGMMTENGMDMLLSWNEDYYHSLCKAILDESRCDTAYISLQNDEKYALKSSLIKQMGTDEEIDVLAATLLASAAQTNQVVINATAKNASMVTTYEDMWKMTIANYYSGSGCLNSALSDSFDPEKTIKWDNVADNLSSSCRRAKDYVDKVMGLAGMSTDG